MTRARGAWLIRLAAVIGMGISAFDYVTPETGLANTEAAMLTLVSSALMLLAALAWGVRALPAWLARFCMTAIALDIIGTALAGYLMESRVLLGAMALALLGWLIAMMGRRRGMLT